MLVAAFALVVGWWCARRDRRTDHQPREVRCERNDRPWGIASFTITVSNTGAGSASNIVITDPSRFGPRGPRIRCGCRSVADDRRVRATCNVGT
jgi:hypothetical protein